MKGEVALSSPARLRICGYLSGCGEADFKAVTEYCGLSQSGLSRQLTALHADGLVDILKVPVGRYTKTRVRLTEQGRRVLLEHVAWLQEIATAAAQGDRTAPQHEMTRPPADCETGQRHPEHHASSSPGTTARRRTTTPAGQVPRPGAVPDRLV